jgi:hypothetical protein
MSKMVKGVQLCSTRRDNHQIILLKKTSNHISLIFNELQLNTELIHYIANIIEQYK